MVSSRQDIADIILLLYSFLSGRYDVLRLVFPTKRYGVLRLVLVPEHQSQVVGGICTVVPGFFFPTKRNRRSPLIRTQISPIVPFSVCLHTQFDKSQYEANSTNSILYDNALENVSILFEVSTLVEKVPPSQFSWFQPRTVQW